MDQLIFDTAKANGMPDTLSRLIVAQAKHESGNYKSPVFKSDNNFFGYKYRGQKIAKPGRTVPENEWQKKNVPEFYARYEKPEDSILELVNWIKRRQKEKVFPKDLSTIQTPYQYATLLKKTGYYGDTVSNYTKGLTRYLKTVAIAASVSVLPIALLVGLYFLLRK